MELGQSGPRTQSESADCQHSTPPFISALSGASDIKGLWGACQALTFQQVPGGGGWERWEDGTIEHRQGGRVGKKMGKRIFEHRQGGENFKFLNIIVHQRGRLGKF